MKTGQWAERKEGNLYWKRNPFWTQETHCIFMIMHLFDFCLKNWQHVAIKVFLQNSVKMSIVTKRHVIDRVGQKKIPHCQQWEVS